MTLWQFGYGTLINRQSLGATIGQKKVLTLDIRPAILHGYKRLFNLRPDEYKPSHKLTDATSTIETAAHNVEHAPDFHVNGVIIPVEEDDLIALDKREDIYVREQTTVTDFFTGETYKNVFVYVAPLDSPHIIRDNIQLLPRWRDINLTRPGAYVIHPDFGRMYDETTYLADGTTLIFDVYRDVIQREFPSDNRAQG